jgi:hypothetical protein
MMILSGKEGIYANRFFDEELQSGNSKVFVEIWYKKNPIIIIKCLS